MHYEERVLNDETWFRTDPNGLWTKKIHPIDKLIQAIEILLGVRKKAVLMAIGMDYSTLTHIRQGKCILSPKAILKIYDATGMPIDQIREISNTPAFTSG